MEVHHRSRWFVVRQVTGGGDLESQRFQEVEVFAFEFGRRVTGVRVQIEQTAAQEDDGDAIHRDPRCANGEAEMNGLGVAGPDAGIQADRYLFVDRPR
ncbi:hypothetical protein ACFQYP_33635 [Nonomuraea antimicrobica]|uniref:hypothetical protein n=1 Tax=Nonomuraea antimicrobica TaxID=561173 RepID=UPI0031E6EF5A